LANKQAITGFLIIAGFNALAGVAFLIFYFLMASNDTQGTSNYLLLATIVAFGASLAALFTYRYFKKKLGA